MSHSLKEALKGKLGWSMDRDHGLCPTNSPTGWASTGWSLRLCGPTDQFGVWCCLCDQPDGVRL